MTKMSSMMEISQTMAFIIGKKRGYGEGQG